METHEYNLTDGGVHSRQATRGTDAERVRHRPIRARGLRSVCNYEVEFDKLAHGIKDTSYRAMRLADDASRLEDDPFKNPTTGFYRLTDSIARKEVAAWNDER